MMRKLKQIIKQILFFVLTLNLGALALAQAIQPWPKAKPLTLVVPFGAGGSLDATARLVAQHLGSRLGQTVNVENVTGAGGLVGIQKAMSAQPDGYTYLIAGDAPLTPGAAGQSSYRFDMTKDMVPTVLVNTAPMVLVAHPSVPVNTFEEWVAYTKRNPGRLNYASSGIGTLPHLAMEMVKRRANLHVVHIPYRGGAQIATDVTGKQIELAMLISASALPPIRGGGVKAIAVTGDTRLAALPNVPLVGESKDFKGYNVVSWSGLYAPAKTPTDLVQRMSEEVSAVLKLDAVKARLSEQSVFAQGGSPAAFTQFIERDRAWVMEILKTLSLKE